MSAALSYIDSSLEPSLASRMPQTAKLEGIRQSIKSEDDSVHQDIAKKPLMRELEKLETAGATRMYKTWAAVCQTLFVIDC